jgi:hypothetical protein
MFGLDLSAFPDWTFPRDLHPVVAAGIPFGYAFAFCPESQPIPMPKVAVL